MQAVPHSHRDRHLGALMGALRLCWTWEGTLVGFAPLEYPASPMQVDELEYLIYSLICSHIAIAICRV